MSFNFTSNIQSDLPAYFRLPLDQQRQSLPELIDHLFDLPPETWARPWTSQAQSKLEAAAAHVVKKPVIRRDNGQPAANWAGCYWVVQLSLQGEVISVTAKVGGEVSQAYDKYLQRYALVKAVCRLLTVEAGATSNLSPVRMQQYFNEAVPNLGHVYRGSYYHHAKQVLIGVSGAEVSWEQRRQWLPDLTPIDELGRANAIAGALDDDFARYVAWNLAGHRWPHIESAFLAELRGAH